MKQNRRRFLSDLLCTGAALLVWPRALSATSVRSSSAEGVYGSLAFDVATALTIAQYALSAAKLFQGSSSSGISTLQIRMFETISKQLNVLQETIAIILRDLEEVKKLLGAIPAEVVRELSDASLRGSFIQYRELMGTYVRYDSDRREFLRLHKPEMDAVTDRIRNNSRILSVYNNFLNVPVMSSAAYVEYNCMVMTGEQEHRIAEAMITYRDYFKRVLYDGPTSLTAHIMEVRRERAELVAMATRAQTINAYIPSSWGYGLHFPVLGHSDFDVTLDRERDASGVAELAQLGLINPEERWVKVTRTNVAQGVLQNVGSITDWAQTFQGPGMNRNTVPITSLPTYAAALSALDARRTELEGNINLKTSQLYAAVSCHFAGNRALNFCQQF